MFMGLIWYVLTLQNFEIFVKIQIFGYGFWIGIHNSHASSFLCFEIKL